MVVARSLRAISARKQPLRGSLLQAKRWNSTLEYEDPNVTKRKEHIQTYLTGKPFDGLDGFSAKMDLLGRDAAVKDIGKMNPETLPSPFVHFDDTLALAVILNEASGKAELTKYDYFLRHRWDSSDKFQNKINMALNRNKRYLKKYKIIKTAHREDLLNLTADLKSTILEIVLANGELDFKQCVEKTVSAYPSISFESMVALYVKIIPELPEKNKKVFLEHMNQFFIENILHLHDHTIESICLNLIRFKNTESVTSILRAYNEFSHSDFLSVMSLEFSQEYLKGLIEGKDIRTSKTTLEYIESKGYTPDASVVTSYLQMCKDVCLNVNAPKDKKELLFNLFANPIRGIAVQDGILNEEIVLCLATFMRVNIIHLFIKYLKSSTDYYKLTSIPDIVLDRIISSSSFQKKPDQNRAAFLTSIHQELGFTDTSLSESFKKSLIYEYANAHATLAVLLWSKKLETPLSSVEKEEILRLLQGDSDNVSSGFDISEKL